MPAGGEPLRRPEDNRFRTDGNPPKRRPLCRCYRRKGPPDRPPAAPSPGWPGRSGGLGRACLPARRSGRAGRPGLHRGGRAMGGDGGACSCRGDARRPGALRCGRSRSFACAECYAWGRAQDDHGRCLRPPLPGFCRLYRGPMQHPPTPPPGQARQCRPHRGDTCPQFACPPPRQHSGDGARPPRPPHQRGTGAGAGGSRPWTRWGPPFHSDGTALPAPDGAARAAGRTGALLRPLWVRPTCPGSGG